MGLTCSNLGLKRLRMHRILSIVLFALVALVSAHLELCLKNLGCMQGTLMPGYQTDHFEAFMGIPFAEPPVGNLRFRNPVAAKAWSGVLNASAPHDHCLQKNYLFMSWPVMGTEDCLYLNIYRPMQRGSTLLPVMVYIHSGGLFSGSAHPVVSGPEYLMDTQAVILVTISYRLGAFGFLSTGDAHMPGNFGLKDQRLALQWIQQHISGFGGDPNFVTIFGHSAGGVSTHFHMLSEGSKGLFQRAMSLSGTALAPFARVVKQPLEQARHLATHLGIPDAKTMKSKNLAKALRKIDAMELLNAGGVLKKWDSAPIINFGAVVEQNTTPDAFFVEDPVQTHLAGKKVNQVPWLLGTTTRAGEGSIFLLCFLNEPQLAKEFNEDFIEKFAMASQLPEETPHEVIKEILDLYGAYELNNDTVRSLSEAAGDFNFQYPAYESAASYAKYADLQHNPVATYSFEYSGMMTLSIVVTDGTVYDVGAWHMDDAMYTLRFGMMPEFPRNSEDAMVVKRMTSLFVDFAKTGIFYNQSSLNGCKVSDFTDTEVCNYLKIEQKDGIYNEAIERNVDKRSLHIWKKLFS